MLFVFGSGLGFPAAAKADPWRDGDAIWSNTFYAGLMTKDKIGEFSDGPEFADGQLLGYALTYDRPFNDRWSIGFELQATAHIGAQEYFEFGVPVTIRFRPEDSFLDAVAFGLGMSHTTKLSDVEVETRGESRRNLIYWMLEAEFETKTPGRSWFMRVHHRSDAWGLMNEDGGSNGIGCGIKYRF